ncbi:MAG: hypothetical protein WBA93_17350 [Microcoleaceae cyanobacterium]
MLRASGDEKEDQDQLKADSERWQQIKETAYAGSLGTNEQFIESIEKIAELAGLPKPTPGLPYIQTISVRNAALASCRTAKPAKTLAQ